jgi:hypothetical protein
MQDKRSSRRPAGTGSLTIRTDRAGRRSWYAKWREGERQVKRRLGPVRENGSDVGLTRRQAEAQLRGLLSHASASAAVAERLTLAEAGERYLRHVEHFRGRKPSTVQDYRITVHRHLAPFFAGRSLDAIDRATIRAYQQAKLRDGLTPQDRG